MLDMVAPAARPTMTTSDALVSALQRTPEKAALGVRDFFDRVVARAAMEAVVTPGVLHRPSLQRLAFSDVRGTSVVLEATYAALTPQGVGTRVVSVPLEGELLRGLTDAVLAHERGDVRGSAETAATDSSWLPGFERRGERVRDLAWTGPQPGDERRTIAPMLPQALFQQIASTLTDAAELRLALSNPEGAGRNFLDGLVQLRDCDQLRQTTMTRDIASKLVRNLVAAGVAANDWRAARLATRIVAICTNAVALAPHPQKTVEFIGTLEALHAGGLGRTLVLAGGGGIDLGYSYPKPGTNDSETKRAELAYIRAALASGKGPSNPFVSLLETRERELASA